eukprot:3380691-Rhodomonas_salina.1
MTAMPKKKKKTVLLPYPATLASHRSTASKTEGKKRAGSAGSKRDVGGTCARGRRRRSTLCADCPPPSSPAPHVVTPPSSPSRKTRDT